MSRKLTLKDLGVEQGINLLRAPKYLYKCKYNIESILKCDDNVMNIASDLLRGISYKNAWIFIISDYDISGAYTSGDGVRYFSTAVPKDEKINDLLSEKIKIIKSMIDEVKPSYIGVLQHIEKDYYRVVV